MKRRASATKKKTSAADLLASPPPSASPNRSPEQFEFNIGAAFNTTAATSSKARNNRTSPLPQRNHQVTVSPPPMAKNLNSISDLKGMASSRLDSVKRHVDRSHSEIVKDLEASQSRLHKRFKIQAQACQQVMDEAEKEYRKMSERISESKEAMKASYLEFMAEAQASASRVCKTSIPELSQSFDKALDALRSRYGATNAI